MSLHRSISRSWTVLTLCFGLALAACGGGGGGGGGGGDDSGGAPSACERVSAGPTSITIRNQLASGLQAMLVELSFGADMLAGECNIVGFDTLGRSLTIRLELQQCSNSSADSSCSAEQMFGPLRTVNVPVVPGDSRTVVVDAATFR